MKIGVRVSGRSGGKKETGSTREGVGGGTCGDKNGIPLEWSECWKCMGSHSWGESRSRGGWL